MKRILILLLAALMLLSTACAAAKAPQAPETRTFTDSVGRTVAVPCTIDKVAVSGPLAQIVLFALCPDKLAGIANPWDRAAEQFFDKKYYDLLALAFRQSFAAHKIACDPDGNLRVAFFRPRQRALGHPVKTSVIADDKEIRRTVLL